MTADPDSARATSPPLWRLLEQAGDAILAVKRGRSLTHVLANVPAPLRPGVQALAFHVLRRLGAAQVVREALAPKAPPPAVDALLLAGIALLWPDTQAPYPDHTLVDQAVDAARHRAPRSAAFVNAVLRRFVREREACVQAASRVPLGAWNHPAWWIETVRADWPAQWQDLLAADQAHAPMALRVNRRQATAVQYRDELAAAGLVARVAGPQSVVLDAPVPVERLPGFVRGRVSVQDLSAQRAAPLLVEALAGEADAAAPAGEADAAAPAGEADAAALAGEADAAALAGEADAALAGTRVLDACAAPGGKTAHLLELADLDVLALDADAGRLARVDDTLRRLGFIGPGRLEGAGPAQPDTKGGPAVRTLAADARRPDTWWDGRPFDAILLDAPCTASGIVRRHPDIRWLRRPEDVPALVRLQAELLEALWPLLRPGGWLLYATCSTFRAEGERQIDAFLQRRGGPGTGLDPRSPGHLLPLPDNGSTVAGTSGSPPAASGDGFFYALLRKGTADPV